MLTINENAESTKSTRTFLQNHWKAITGAVVGTAAAVVIYSTWKKMSEQTEDDVIIPMN